MCYVDLRWERSSTPEYVIPTITQQSSSTFAPFIIALSEADKEALRTMVRDVIREELHRMRKDDEHREEQR